MFLVVGVLLTLATSVYRPSRPRHAGEPFGPVRSVHLSLSLIGWLCVLIGTALLID